MGKTAKTHSCDLIEVKTKDQTLQGLLMPGSDEEKIILKLPSGYNVGIARKKVEQIKVVQQGDKSEKACVSSLEPSAKQDKHRHNKELPTISILHTGGTISSKIDYATGGVSATFTPEEIVGMFPDLGTLANIHSRLISNMFSEDLRFGHYNIMAKEVEKELKKGVAGVIITHGTDTMHYTAAALSFILEGLGKPVLLVGSQRSSDRGSSDAALNLLCAVRFIIQTNFAGVGICMHEQSSDESCLILPATKTRKMHTSRRDAFKTVNAEPLARIAREGKITYFDKKHHQEKHGALQIKPIKENVQIGMAIMHPHMYAKELEAYSDFDGLIIQGTGLGHAPVNVLDDATREHQKILEALQKLAKTMPVVMTSQTLFGRVNMEVYSTGRKLLEIGILGNYADMLPEVAYIKLAWLLSNYPRKKVDELMHENLRGEITKRSLQHTFEL